MVKFDADTDYGAGVPLGGTFECPLLFDYPGIHDSDECSWTSGNDPSKVMPQGDTVQHFASSTE
ncbi:unnamed protein product [Sphacelaria rigidula]